MLYTFAPLQTVRRAAGNDAHACAGNNWKLILRDQMNKIMFSGLYDHLDGIYAVICGNFEEPMIEAQDFLESARRGAQRPSQHKNVHRIAPASQSVLITCVLCGEAVMYASLPLPVSQTRTHMVRAPRSFARV